MRYQEIKPDEQLQPFIKCIWHLQREYREAEFGEVLWPDGCQEIIFHYGARYHSGGEVLPRSFFIGMLSHYHHLKAQGLVRLFGIRLLPWGFPAFFKSAVKVNNDRMVPLSSLLNNSAVERLENLLEDKQFEEAVEIIQDFLKANFSPEQMDMSMVEVLSKLYYNPLQYDIAWAVDKSGYSQRHFERKCVELTGMTPKRLHKVSRFNLARLHIFHNPRIDLMECAIHFGYYDYAHFSKDFKLCLGITPAEYQKWILRIFEGVPSSNDVVFLQD